MGWLRQQREVEDAPVKTKPEAKQSYGEWKKAVIGH